MMRIYGDRLKVIGISGSSGSVDYGTPTAKTLASNVLTVTKPGYYTLTSESGTSDQLDRIDGLNQGEIVLLQAASGHTITVAAGTYMKMPSNFVLNNVYDKLEMICEGSSVCSDKGRHSNA